MSSAPTELEILSGILLGKRSEVEPITDSGEDVRAALERAMLPALQRAPCLVSFSGGRDSSAILAVATATARRHGLPDPVPATMAFPLAPETAETEWQQLVLDHLRIRERIVVELRDELDGLGAIATAVLRRDGVRWPSNRYMHEALLGQAAGGSLMTGAGGDELLDTKAGRLVLLARRRARPQPRDALRLAYAVLPRRVRAAIWARNSAPRFPWLTEAGNDRVRRAAAADAVAWPERWDSSVRHWHSTRAYAGLRDAVPALARQRDVLGLNPFLDVAVLGAMRRAGGPCGFANRTAAMRVLFGDLLPDQVLARPDKARFGAPVWGPATREFAQSWRGAGVDESYVDVAALRREWVSDAPSFASLLLMQHAWLASQPTVASS